jgi:hypothetical protein
MNEFTEIARKAVQDRIKVIRLIPGDAVIDPKHLGTLTNEQFVSAFGIMQKLLIS